jgi:hypothetical protein
VNRFEAAEAIGTHTLAMTAISDTETASRLIEPDSTTRLSLEGLC